MKGLLLICAGIVLGIFLGKLLFSPSALRQLETANLGGFALTLGEDIDRFREFLDCSSPGFCQYPKTGTADLIVLIRDHKAVGFLMVPGSVKHPNTRLDYWKDFRVDMEISQLHGSVEELLLTDNFAGQASHTNVFYAEDKVAAWFLRDTCTGTLKIKLIGVAMAGDEEAKHMLGRYFDLSPKWCDFEWPQPANF